MANVGKKFEQSFIKSVPPNVAIIRMPDAAQSFFQTSHLRFSLKNPYDYIFWSPYTLTIYALELKTVKGKSISFERTKDEKKKEIHYHQIQGLKNFKDIGGSVCGLIIEFRELETTVFIDVDDFIEMTKVNPKKSFNFKDLETFEVPYIVIPQKKLKTNYKYDIETFLEKTRLH